jgi:hypothetical protein
MDNFSISGKQSNLKSNQCAKKGLTISIKHVRQHLTSEKVALANYIVIMTTEFAK